MATNKDIEKDYSEAYTQAWGAFSGWQAAAKEDLRAYLGDSYTSEEKVRLRKQGRKPLNIQMIRRIINWVSGFQRDHRLGIKFDPTENADVQTASQLTAVVHWALTKFFGYNIISDSFEHALKTGLSLVNAYSDQNFNPKLDLVAYNQFLLDPTFTRTDLADCGYGIIRKYITPDMAKMILPETKHAMIKKAEKEQGDGPCSDSKFPNYSQPRLFGRQLLAYDEFQRHTVVPEFVVLLKDSGKEIAWRGTRKELDAVLFRLVREIGMPPENVIVLKRNKSTVEVASLLNGNLVSNEIDPFGLDDYSFTPVIGYYTPEYDDMSLKLQGLVRCLVDPQIAENKRIMSMIAWFEQQIGCGLDYEEGSLVDDEDAFVTGPGKPRMFTEGALSQGRARDRVVPSMPSGLIELHTILDTAMPKMVNVNEEMFGNTPQNTNAEVSGVLAKLRQGAGLVGLRGLFDNLSMSQAIIGSKILKLVQQFPSYKVSRVLGTEPTPEFSSRNFGTYDATATESMLTDTQRDMAYAELINMKKMGVEMQDPAPITWKSIITYAPIQMREDLLKEVSEIEKKQQERQAQAQKQEQRMQELMVQATLTQMKENNAQADERNAQVKENQTNSVLNQVKTMAQISEIKNKPILELLKTMAQIEKANIAADAKKGNVNA